MFTNNLPLLVSFSIPSKINFPFPLIVIISLISIFLELLNSLIEFINTLPSSIISFAIVLEHLASSDTKLSSLTEEIIILKSSYAFSTISISFIFSILISAFLNLVKS